MRKKRENIMLAVTASTASIRNLGPQFFVQPKYKGQRLRVEWFHGDPVLLSSYGEERLFFPHIKDALLELPHLPWDGEAYVHGWTQEHINSVCNRTVNEHPEAYRVEFHIFDYQGIASTQMHRIQRLLIVQHKFGLLSSYNSPLRISPVKLATPTTWMPWLQQWMDEDYEGIIFRKPDALYVMSRRTGLLKFKPTETDEYTIVAMTEAVDKYGVPKDILGAFHVKGDDGNTFKVGAGKLTHERRKYYWNNEDEVIGKQLLTKHEDSKTRHGVPVCAVAVEVVK